MVSTPSNPQQLDRELTAEELRKIDAYWRACNYLALGMIYLRDNPLLKEKLKAEHIKARLLGHWGTSSALSSFTYVHLNRLILRIHRFLALVILSMTYRMFLFVALSSKL